MLIHFQTIKNYPEKRQQFISQVSKTPQTAAPELKAPPQAQLNFA